MALTLVVVLGLARVLPDRLRLVRASVLVGPELGILASMLAVWWTQGQRRWLKVERGWSCCVAI